MRRSGERREGPGVAARAGGAADAAAGTGGAAEASAAGPARAAGRLEVGALGLWLGYALLLFYAGTFYGVLDWQGALLLHLLQAGGALGAGLLLWRQARRETERWGVAVLGGAAALLLWVDLSWWWAPAPRFVWGGVLGVAGGVGWGVLAAAALAAAATRRRSAILCALLLAATALWSYAEYRAGVTVRPALPLGHHNFLAGVLVMLFGPTAAVALRARPATRGATLAAWPARGAALLALMALAGTSSLSGAAGAAAGTATALLLWWRLLRPRGGRRRRHTRRFIAAAAVLLAGCALVLALTPGGPRIYSRAGALLSGRALADTSVRNRLDYSRGALAGLAAERPLTGFGPGSVALRFPLYRVQRNEPEEIGKVVTQLHSTPAQILFETGLVGGALALGLLLALVRRARLRLCAAGGAHDTRDLRIRIGAACGLAAYAVAALGDFQLHVAALPATIALLLGILFGGAPTSPGPGAAGPAASFASFATRALPRLLATLLVLTAVVAGARHLPIVRAHYQWDRARTALLAAAAADASPRPAVVDRLQRAIALDPDFGFYQECLADLLQRHPELAAGRGLPTSAALAPLLDAARATPYAPLFAARAGRALLAADHPTAAIRWLHLATALELASPLTWYHLGRAQLAAGDRRGARRSWAHALSLEPALAGAAPFADPTDPAFDRTRRLLARLAPGVADAAADSAGVAPAPAATWHPNARLETSHDADPWRSTAAFVFRRHGLAGTALAIPIDLNAPQPITPRRPLLPRLPNRACDWLREHATSPQMVE